VSSAVDSRAPRWISIILPRLAFYPFLAASLLVFPAVLPCMILGWIALWALQVGRKKPAWPPLAFCLGVILVKRVDWAPGLIVLGLVMSGVAVFDIILRRNSRVPERKFILVAAGLLAVTWTAMAWNWERAIHTHRRPLLQADRPIAIIGDSLASGGFSRVLGKRLRVPVADFAVGGITTAQGLKRFPELMDLNPQAVVIELGGHDYLQGRSRLETRKNLEQMIQRCRESGVEVFLFEVPRGFITDPFAGLERDLARKYDVEVITDGAIRKLVLFSPFMPLSTWIGPHLSYDGLHPNDAGNLFLADVVEKSLRRVYGDAAMK
jgi:acyl-CoA thioesterase-1